MNALRYFPTLILSTFLLTSCGAGGNTEVREEDNSYNNNSQTIQASQLDREVKIGEKEEPKDKLEIFWTEFQKAVANKDKEKVASYFKFPFINAFAYIEEVEETEFDEDLFLKYYDYFFGECVSETIAKITVKDLQKTDKGFQFVVNYPKPKDEPAGEGAGIFSFVKQNDTSYKITVVSCAGGCGGDCE